jgi:hypothetical protein
MGFICIICIEDPNVIADKAVEERNVGKLGEHKVSIT